MTCPKKKSFKIRSHIEFMWGGGGMLALHFETFFVLSFILTLNLLRSEFCPTVGYKLI